jgi:hypothetical protein
VLDVETLGASKEKLEREAAIDNCHLAIETQFPIFLISMHR